MMGGLMRTPARRSERIRMRTEADVNLTSIADVNAALEVDFQPNTNTQQEHISSAAYFDTKGCTSTLHHDGSANNAVPIFTGDVFNTENVSTMRENLNRTFSLPDMTMHQRQFDVGAEKRNRVTISHSLNHVGKTVVNHQMEQEPNFRRPNSAASSSKSATLKRKKLEVQLEFSKRKFQHQQEMLQLEESLRLAQIEEEFDNVSQSSCSVSSSIRRRLANVASWVDDNRSRDQHATLLQESNHAEEPSRRHEPMSISIQNMAQTEMFNFNSTRTHQQCEIHDKIQKSREQIQITSNPLQNGRQMPVSVQVPSYSQNDAVLNQNYLSSDHHHLGTTPNISHNNHQSSQQASKIHQLENWITRQSINKDLPKFAGNPLEWPQFINQFETTTQLCNLSDAENQIRLQKSLTGQALSIVQPLLIYPNNVNRVIQILKNRFGRTEHIVHLLLDRVRNFICIKDENDLNSIIDFFDVLSNFIYTLESLDERDHIRNPILYNEVLNKLPMKFKFGFVEYLELNCFSDPPLLTLHSWLERKVSAAHKLLIPSLQKARNDSTSTKFSGTKSKALHFSIVEKEKKVDSCCLFCENKNHSIQTCEKFKKIKVNERWNFVTKKRACISCLKLNHSLKVCKKRKKCDINNCDKFHNHLLHNEPINRPSKVVPSGDVVSETNLHLHNEKRFSLLKILPVQLKGTNMTIDSYALLDEGSTVTIIDSDIAEKLGLDGPTKHLKLQWTNSQFNEQKDSKVVSLGIKSQNSDKFYTLRCVKTVRDLNLPMQTLNMENLVDKYPYLKHLSDLSYVDAKPVIIIGQDNWPVTVSRKLSYGIWNGPVASKTLLGWVVHGNICDSSKNDIHESLLHVHEKESESYHDQDDLSILQELIKQQWSFDISGTCSDAECHPSVEDQYCYEIMEETLYRKGDRFECGLFWKDKNVVLPESKSTALKRLECLERKMDRDRNYGEIYVEKMNDYISKGYLKKLSNTELTDSQKSWFLPHFGVLNPNKPGKLRIVFDAAAKSNGKSLNDFLLIGPDLYNHLPDILMNFRIHRFAFVGDIREMFLQIGVREEDRFAQRILWRGFDRLNDPDVYEFQVVFFGAKCSPSIAQEVRNRNARELMSEFPEACDDIVKKHYMDDYLGGADSEENAIKLIKDVIHVHRKGGFQICNFISNSQIILNSIDENLLSKNVSEGFNFSCDTEERVLGMWWDYRTDEFLFKHTFHKIDRKVLNHEAIPTKRDILKIVMSVFDPLGLISNLIIEGKILMQQIWESGIGWDDNIQTSHYNIWITWSSNLEKCAQVRIPRIFFNGDVNSCEIELHIFCDASQFAYASVAYLRFVSVGEINCVLISSKARVAPLKPISVPRLELMAALLGARLNRHVMQSLNFNIVKSIFWSDSQIVLSWVKSSSKRFKTFVAQRIGEIHEISQPDSWKYVPSKLNVADQATKIKNVDLNSKGVWFTGPEFLYRDESEWPSTKILDVDQSDCCDEFKAEFCFVMNTEVAFEIPIPDVKRFSNWLRFIRSVAWVNKFIKVLKRRIRKEALSCQKELLPEDILEAEILIFRKIQHDCFFNEKCMLKNKAEIPKSSSIASFNCFLDGNGILRIRSRLDNCSEVSHDTKCPIILDNSHEIVKLMVSYYHKIHNHIGLEQIICDIRKRFWIISIRRAVKYAAYSCQYCRLKKSKNVISEIGQLPMCRVNKPLRPFIKCGIDYFGPINVTVNRHHEKRYGVLFICMALKAIHIEIAHDLSFNSFMHVFLQFGNRRGFPSELYSDNGKQFTKASKEICNALESWPENNLTQFLTHRKCKWFFNAPVAPHTGGLWERMIGLIKTHLSNILHEKYPREFVLRTLFTEIEGIINSRPLTYNSSDPNDLEPITPNHFLIGPSSNCYPLIETSEKDLTILSVWRASQRLADTFWKRWVVEYIPLLMHSRKWLRASEKLSIGDLVLMVDSKNPRNVWPRGIIDNVYQAKDGQVRYVDVNTNVGIYRRHVKYVIKLDILNNCNSLDLSE